MKEITIIWCQYLMTNEEVLSITEEIGGLSVPDLQQSCDSDVNVLMGTKSSLVNSNQPQFVIGKFLKVFAILV